MAQLKDLLVEGKSRFIDKIYASDQFISKVAQGTSPFLIDSSTLVSNLNVDMVDGQHFTYSNTNNTPTYLWGTSSDGTNYLVSRASMHSGVADKVSTIASTSTGNFYLTFVDSNNTPSAAEETVYTTAKLYIQPSTGDIHSGGYVYVKNTTACLGADSNAVVWLKNSSGYLLVCDANVVRRGASLTNGQLGSSSAYWADTYTKLLHIDSSSAGAVNHIVFNRANWNYIGLPAGGSFSVNINGTGAANSYLLVNTNEVTPGAKNGIINLGTDSSKWKTVYSTAWMTQNNAVLEDTSGRLAIGTKPSHSAAKGLNVGDLLVSDLWADRTKIPTNGIYSKGQIKSGVAQGTAPFVVNSSTLVTNLNADLLDSYHADSFLQRLRRLNESFGHSSIASGMFPPALFELKSAGYPVYDDPEFASGTNSINVYNNSGGGTVTITREQAGDHANSSGYQLKIVTNGTASPGAGGFYQSITSRANAIFVQIFRAKVPVGYSVTTASNSMGANYQDKFITNREGTGKWEWYARVVYCGASGSFANGGHVYLSANSGYSNTSVTWYVSHCSLIDITKGNYNGLRTKYADIATSASSATNTDTVDNEHAAAFAHRQTWNNMVHSGNEYTWIAPGYTGGIWINYRTSSGSTDGSINEYIFGTGKGTQLAKISLNTFHGNITGDAATLGGLPLSRFVYSVGSGDFGTSERSGNSENFERTMFWRDNNKSAIGVFVSHSTATTYGWEIHAGYSNTSNFVGRVKENGTWGAERIFITSANYSSYLGYIGTTAVQASSANQALTGISSINGRLTIGANSDLTSIGFGRVHNVEFGEAGYAHREYYFRPSYGANGVTYASLNIQNASAAASPTFTTTHRLDYNGNAYHSGNIYLDTGDSDRFIQFRYNANNYAGASWRLLSRGSGSGDANYFDIETGGSSSSSNTWYRALRLTMDNRRVGLSVDAPTQKLHVGGNARFDGGIGSTGTNGNVTGAYVVHPEGGVYATNSSSVTGYLKITLPQKGKNTMMSFDVTIYTYDGANQSYTTYHISGYEYSTNGWYEPVTKVYSEGIGPYTNLTVRLGNDGTYACVTIGEANTVWTYPQVTVHNIMTGYSNSGVDTWIGGWAVGFTTTALTTVVATRSSVNTQNINVSGSAGSVAWGNITGKPSSFTPADHNHDGRYLQYNGWWTSGNGNNADNANGMVFAYSNHNVPTGWGILTTFDYQYNSSYKMQLYSYGYTNGYTYYRNRSADRNGWNAWVRFLDSTNYTEYLSDTKVTQTITASSNTSWRPLLLGYSYSDAATFAPTTVTNTTYATHLAKFKPSTGQLAIGGLYKMNTNGTQATGANDEVWNTNGTTVKISTLFTTEPEYLTMEVKNATSPSTPVTAYVGVTITNKFTNEIIYEGVAYQNTHLVPGTTTYTTNPIEIPPGIEYVITCSYITGYATPEPGVFLSIPGYSRTVNLNFTPVRVDILSVNFANGSAPSAFLTYTPASGTSVIQWIRNNSHRYAAYFAKLTSNITDGNGNILSPRGAQMYICQLKDSDSTRFANDNSYLYPTDASVENGDIYMRLPEFYYRVSGDSSAFTVEFADVDPKQAGFQKWDSNNMIAVYLMSSQTGILVNNSSSTKIDAYVSSPYFQNTSISGNNVALNNGSCVLSSATISSSGTIIDKFAGGVDKASIKNLYPEVDVKFLRYKWIQILRLLFMAYYKTTDAVSVCGTSYGSSYYKPSDKSTQGRGMNDTTSSTGNGSPCNFWGVEELWGLTSIYTDIAWQYYYVSGNANNVNKIGILADNVVNPDLNTSTAVIYKFGSVPTDTGYYYGRTIDILSGTPTTMEQKLTYSPIAFSYRDKQYGSTVASSTQYWFSKYSLNASMSTGSTYHGIAACGNGSLFEENLYRTAPSAGTRICYYGPIQEVYSPTVFYNSIKPNSAIYRRLRGNTAIPAG